ncbi:MAG: hypothetical protein R3195_10365 [Gemmatimonadota bacterium]|nr:hypothetical protein [Gemmatimonadota bacterium]
MSERARRIEVGTLFVGAVFAIGAVLRLILLKADPAYHGWYGAVLDEGRWTAAARVWVLFGSIDFGVHFTRLHAMLAPGFQAIMAGVFKVFGVGFESARLVSAAGGIGLLTASIVLLRKHLSTGGLAVVALALAIQPDLLFLSRVAIPEVPAMLFEFLAFAVLVSRPLSVARAFGAGLVSAAALAVKATSAPIVLALAVSALLIHRIERQESGLPRLGAYLFGLALPALLAIPVAIALLVGSDVPFSASLATLLRQLEVDTVYGMLSTPFTAPYGPALYALLLPAWLICGVLISAGATPAHPARVIYWTSAVWAVSWLMPTAVLDYFPDRYTQHAYVPLAINIGAGVTLLQAMGRERVAAATRGGEGIRGAIGAAWLALPAAVLLCSLLFGVAGLTGLEEARLRFQLPTVVLVTLVLASAHVWLGASRPVGPALITLPLVFAPLWWLGTHTGVVSGAFWDTSTTATLWKLVLLAVATGCVILIRRSTARPGSRRIWAGAYPVLIAGLWLAQVSPRYLRPSYATAEASATIEALADDTVLVGSMFASSVFLGNSLPYTENMADIRNRPDLLVAAFLPLRPAYAEQYRLVERFVVDGMSCVGGACVEGWEPVIRIYRRVP